MLLKLCHVFQIYAVPLPPNNLNILTIDGDPYSLNVTWDPPTTPNGYITSYTIYCEEYFYVGSGSGLGLNPLPFNEPLPIFISNVPGNELYVRVTDLAPFTIYECYVSANTSVGEGNVSASVIQTTDEFGKVNVVISLL